MAKVKLNEHLDDMLERLMNEGLTQDELNLEVQRSKALCQVAGAVIESQKLILQAVQMVASGDISADRIPSNLEEVKLLK